MQISQSDLTALFVAMGVDTATGWDAAKLEAKVNQAGGVSRYRDADRVLDDPELETLFQSIVTAQAGGAQITVTPDAADVPDPSVFGNPDPAPGVAQAEPAAPPAAKPKPAGKKPAKEKPVAVTAKPKPKPAARATAKPKAQAKPKPAAKKKAAHAPGTNGKAEKDSWNPFGTWDAYKKHYAKNPRPVPEKGVLATVVAELKAAGKGAKPKPVTKDQIVDVLFATFPDRTKQKMATNLNNILPTGLRIEYGIHVWKAKVGDSTGYYIVGDGRTPQPEQPPAEKSAPKPKAAKPKAKAKAVK